MTTEARDELRDRLAYTMLLATDEGDDTTFGGMADAILAELSKTHRLVARDRLDRLLEAGRLYQLWLAQRCGEYQGITQQCLSVVSDDDLDPVP